MFKQGKIEVEVFAVLITMVFTSAVILFLVYSGTIEVKEGISSEPVLNAEFLPAGREGVLAIKEFDFCSYVDENLNCLAEQDEFGKAENVYVRFVVESSVTGGQAMLLRNYEMRNPLGEIILQAEQNNAYNFELSSARSTENVVFGEYFVIGEDAVAGEYTLDVIIENQLIEKKITLTKTFKVIDPWELP